MPVVDENCPFMPKTKEIQGKADIYYNRFLVILSTKEWAYENNEYDEYGHGCQRQ